jgi:hypothetical protein
MPLDRAAVLYERAHGLGLKGCAVYRTGSRAQPTLAAIEAGSCCP